MSGYQASLPVKDFENENQIEFTIIAKRQTQIAFRCLVVKQLTDSHSSGQSPEGPYSTNDGVLYI